MGSDSIHSDQNELAESTEKLEARLERLVADGSLIHIALHAQLHAMHEAQSSLELARDQYASLYDNAPVSYFTLDSHGAICNLNLTAARMLGMERGSILNGPFSAWVCQADKPAFFTHLRQAISSSRPSQEELRLCLLDKQIIHVLLDSICSGEKISGELQLQVAVTDISERKRMENERRAMYEKIEKRVEVRTVQLSRANAELRESQLRERALLDSSPDFVWLKGREGNYLAVNKAFADFFHMMPEELIGKTDFDLWTQSTIEQSRLDEMTILQSHQSLRVEEQLTSKARKSILVETIKTPIVDLGQVIGIAGVARDISEQKAAQERIHYLAHYDSLTGLPNRTLLNERFDRLFAEVHRNHEQFAVFFIDLDRFKAVNDCFGHRVGDLLLVDVAERIKKCVREVDTVARLGGDEFLVIASQLHHAAGASGIAEKMRHTLAEPFFLLGNEVRIGSSIGISLCPQDALDQESLIKFADMAMYQAKQSGRNNFQFFDKSAHLLPSRRAELANRLERALAAGQFTLNFQPVVDVNNGKIRGCEVLLRLEYEGSNIAPAEFIPVAETSGLILSIGKWVLEVACRQNRAWQDAGLPAIPISVNVSGIQFQHTDFADSIRSVLAEAGLQSHCLELELTETIIMNDSEATMRCLNELKDIGVKISLDDFGTGYSSLSYLQNFPIDKLKIDQSFVRNIEKQEKNSALISAMITMAKALHIQVTAEGVETREQLSMLRTESCDYAQGYYCGMPMTAAAFSICLAKEFMPHAFV